MALTDEDLLAISRLMDAKLKPMDAKMDRLDEKVNCLDERMGCLERRMTSVEADNKGMRLLIENQILPRLQNIEACYLSTYRRYAEGIEKMETFRTDMELVKKVVGEHSVRIQKLELAMA